MPNERMTSPCTNEMLRTMTGSMTYGAVVMAIDTAMVTVGSALLGGSNNYYGYERRGNSPYRWFLLRTAY